MTSADADADVHARVIAQAAPLDILAKFGSTEFRGDPPPLLNWLRENEPVHKAASGFYLISRHADAEYALKESGRGVPRPVPQSDPRVFTEPDRFALGRDNSRAPAFGAGIHTCLGILPAPDLLAPEQISAALTELHRQAPRIATAEVAQWGDYRDLRVPASTRVSAR